MRTGITRRRAPNGSLPTLFFLVSLCLTCMLSVSAQLDKCTTCGDVKRAQAECEKLGLQTLGQLQTTLLLNCQAALWPFVSDRCCTAMTKGTSFTWDGAVSCLCGGQTGLSGLVISPKTIVESCGCKSENGG